MILTDKDILGAMADGAIKISPFHLEKLGTNSYDIHLSPHLRRLTEHTLDMRHQPKYEDILIPDDGYVLQPNELYLAASIEYTESHIHVPILEGKSSIGRLGLDVHICAGFGDVGFCGFWTLELRTVKPLRVYAGAPIAQIAWHTAGTPNTPYGAKKSANYAGQAHEPQISKLWKDFENKRIEWRK
jgi:dCTP deaminase